VQSGQTSADLAVVGAANGATTDLADNVAVTNPTGVLRVDGMVPTIAMNNAKSAEVVSGNQKNVTFNWHACDSTGGQVSITSCTGWVTMRRTPGLPQTPVRSGSYDLSHHGLFFDAEGAVLTP
jgi:hypothetical protein